MENEQKTIECANKCGTKKKMSIRNVDVDRDGRVLADIYECNGCNSWVRIPKIETKVEEIDRIKKRLANLEG